MHTVGIPAIQGRSQAAEDTLHQKLVKESQEPYKGELDPRYTPINADDVRAANELFEAVPMFHTAERMNHAAFQQGGMTIQIGTANPKKYKTGDLFGDMCMNTAVQIDHKLNLHGFAATTFTPPNPTVARLFNNLEDSFNTMKEELCVLNPEMLDIYHHKDVFNKSHWVVRERPAGIDLNSTDGGRGGLLGRIIPHVFVFTRDGEGPSETGRLRSRVLSLREDYVQLKRLRDFSMRAHERRSAPAVITERVVSTKDPQVHGLIADSNMDCGRNEGEAPLSSAEKMADRLVRFENVFSQEQHSVLLDYWVHASTLASTSSVEGDRVDLPAERKLARQVLAEAPTDLKEFEIMFDQKVLHSFGIPPGMIQPESVNGKMVANENALEVFHQHLTSMKRELLIPIQIMLRYIHQWRVRVKYIDEHDGRGKISYSKFLNDTRIKVILHGLPPEERLHQFYQQGLLKYDAYIKSLSAIHGIPIEHFEETPAISREDLLTQGRDSMEKTKLHGQERMEKEKFKGAEKLQKQKLAAPGSSAK